MNFNPDRAHRKRGGFGVTSTEESIDNDASSLGGSSGIVDITRPAGRRRPLPGTVIASAKDSVSPEPTKDGLFGEDDEFNFEDVQLDGSENSDADDGGQPQSYF